MWAFTLKMKENIPVKKEVIQKVSKPFKEVLRSKLLRVRTRTFKRLKSFFSRGENGRKTKRKKKCVAHTMDDSELIKGWPCVHPLTGLTVNTVPLSSQAFSSFLLLIPCLLH